jgi:predicted Rossmann-fold nucleotide-binding protein
LTWAQLGLHAKPIALLNVAGYFDPVLAWLDQAIDDGFIKPAHRELLMEAGDAERLLAALQSYRPAPATPKWIDERDR